MQLHKQQLRYRIIRGQGPTQGIRKDKDLRRRRRKISQGVSGVSNLGITLTTIPLLSAIYVSLCTMLLMLAIYFKPLSQQQFFMAMQMRR
jgi:hypothetical protein